MTMVSAAARRRPRLDRATRWIGHALLAAALLGATPAPAAAQLVELMEWLERLSGPRFRGWWVDFSVACWDQNGDRHRVDCKVGETLTPETRMKFDGGRSGLDGFDRKVLIGVRLGYFGSGTTTGFFSGHNNLIYPAGTRDEDKKITQIITGPSLTWQVHPALDLAWAIEFNRFGGPLVDDFTVVSVDPITGIWKPWRHFTPGDRKAGWLRITLRVKKYLDAMRGEQFGALPGFVANAESVLGLGLEVDPRLLLQYLK